MTVLPDWIQQPITAPDNAARLRAAERQRNLTKPAGSLGRLEEIALFMAAAQGDDQPRISNIQISVFVADHGIAAAGVSAFPQAVTAQMISNLAAGGAAISVLARDLDANLEIINLGTATPVDHVDGVLDAVIAPGTASFLDEPAMTQAQFEQALVAGRDSALRAVKKDVDVYIGGEVGIGNTTTATAVACSLLNEQPRLLAGPGTGLDAGGLDHKIDVLEQALRQHKDKLNTPASILVHLGGFEIVALVGAYITCARHGIPVVIDGFISTVAALAATRLRPEVDGWLLYAHASAEPGHQRILNALNRNPLLSLDMRLGEGSGAAVVVPLLQAACSLHNNMATFAEARVAEKKQHAG